MQSPTIPCGESIDRISANRHELRKQGRSFSSIHSCRCLHRGMERPAGVARLRSVRAAGLANPSAGEGGSGPTGTTARQIKNSGDYNVSVRFNRHGFRDRQDVSTGHDEDIYVIGDSFRLGCRRKRTFLERACQAPQRARFQPRCFAECRRLRKAVPLC